MSGITRKKDWKELINRKIDSENREFIINWSRKYKKIDTLSLECEEYEMKSYFFSLSLQDSRMKFRERSGCLKTCRVACPSDPANIKAAFKCYECDDLDTGPSHWLNCRVYSKIITERNLDISKDLDLMQYYKLIIQLRTNV